MHGRLRENCGGNVALMFALLSPVLIGAVGLGVDFQQRLAQRASLQDAADTLALRGARELLLESSNPQSIESLILALADKQFAAKLGEFDVTPSVDGGAMTAAVALSQPSRRNFFLAKLAPTEDPIVVSATAQAKGVTNVCVIALDEQSRGAVKASASATLDAPKCSILSNSSDADGVEVSGLAKITAKLICSAGGAKGGSLNFAPPPLTDCPTYADPLYERAAPDVGACDYVNFEAGKAPRGNQSIITATLTAAVGSLNGATHGTLTGYTRYDLQPGVYCGGIKLNSNADAHLAPGIYVIKDGPLTVDFGARLFGENVGFYFDGAASIFEFKPASIIFLTAPKTGLMAGLLLFESRSAPAGRIHKIESSNARELLGTIYLPQGRLLVNSIMPVADQSAYTAIVARNFEMAGSPKLVLNADYAATDVPVPAGVGPSGGQTYLRD
jgi:Flp pilus assembly protein TadG